MPSLFSTGFCSPCEFVPHIHNTTDPAGWNLHHKRMNFLAIRGSCHKANAYYWGEWHIQLQASDWAINISYKLGLELQVVCLWHLSFPAHSFNLLFAPASVLLLRTGNGYSQNHLFRFVLPRMISSSSSLSPWGPHCDPVPRVCITEKVSSVSIKECWRFLN